MASAAYNADRNDIGHRFSGAAALRAGQSMPVAQYDALMIDYRAWLTFGEFLATKKDSKRRREIAKALHTAWLWSKGQQIGNFGSFHSRNAFIRNAAYAL